MADEKTTISCPGCDAGLGFRAHGLHSDGTECRLGSDSYDVLKRQNADLKRQLEELKDYLDVARSTIQSIQDHIQEFIPDGQQAYGEDISVTVFAAFKRLEALKAAAKPFVDAYAVLSMLALDDWACDVSGYEPEMVGKPKRIRLRVREFKRLAKALKDE